MVAAVAAENSLRIEPQLASVVAAILQLASAAVAAVVAAQMLEAAAGLLAVL